MGNPKGGEHTTGSKRNSLDSTALSTWPELFLNIHSPGAHVDEL